MEANDSEEFLDIDDERVPEVVRDHGRRFRKTARYVVDLGGWEYILSAEDGEVLDFVYLR